MKLRVIGCHGGESPKHRTTAFVLDERLALDAGSLASGLDLGLQCALHGCLVSHAHLDHIKDLATVADNRCQAGCEPLIVAASRATIRVLKKHFFNNLIWPDFSKIPSQERPAIRYLELRPEVVVEVAGFQVRSIPVHHTIDACGFIVDSKSGSIAFSGDTGPTDRFWEVIRSHPKLEAILAEVSFPNREQALASLSGHHTPQSLLKDLKKLGSPQDFPTLLHHIKPVFQREVEKECARIRGANLTVLELGDEFEL